MSGSVEIYRHCSEWEDKAEMQLQSCVHTYSSGHQEKQDCVQTKEQETFESNKIQNHHQRARMRNYSQHDHNKRERKDVKYKDSVW